MVLFSLELLSISGSLYSCITAQDRHLWLLKTLHRLNLKTGFSFFFFRPPSDISRIFRNLAMQWRWSVIKCKKKYKTGFPVELCALDLSLSCLSLLLLNLDHTIQTKVPLAASPGKYISIFFWDQERFFFLPKKITRPYSCPLNIKVWIYLLTIKFWVKGGFLFD